MYVEGIPALLGSPPFCHRARGVNCHKSGHYTPHDQHMVKISKNWWGLMWVSNHTLVTNSGRASVRSESVLHCGRRARMAGGRTAASFFGVQTNRNRLSLHLRQASESRTLDKQVALTCWRNTLLHRNNLERTAGRASDSMTAST